MFVIPGMRFRFCSYKKLSGEKTLSATQMPSPRLIAFFGKHSFGGMLRKAHFFMLGQRRYN